MGWSIEGCRDREIGDIDIYIVSTQALSISAALALFLELASAFRHIGAIKCKIPMLRYNISVEQRAAATKRG